MKQKLMIALSVFAVLSIFCTEAFAQSKLVLSCRVSQVVDGWYFNYQLKINDEIKIFQNNGRSGQLYVQIGQVDKGRYNFRRWVNRRDIKSIEITNVVFEVWEYWRNNRNPKQPAGIYVIEDTCLNQKYKEVCQRKKDHAGTIVGRSANPKDPGSHIAKLKCNWPQ